MWLAFNPLDDLARRAFGLPRTAKGFLATHQNPRPAGIVLGNCTRPLKPWPWVSLTAEDWANEMRHNNGHLIAVLLRHPEIVSSPSFIGLFDALEIEYRAILKRARWAILDARRPGREQVLKSLFHPLERPLALLVDSFVQWATGHRELVYHALVQIMEDERYRSGNAKMDVKRLGVDWL